MSSSLDSFPSFHTSQSDSITFIEDGFENNQPSNLISKDVDEVKLDPLPEIQIKEISSNISDKKEEKVQKKENVLIIKLIDDYKLQIIDFESALIRLEKLKVEGKISDDEFLITKDKIIELYLYN